MTLKIPYVVDNLETRLADVLNDLLGQRSGQQLDVATAYFSIRGFEQVRSTLPNVRHFRLLLGPYLRSARKITITDPYIRLFYQARNLMELLETITRYKQEDEIVAVHLVTVEDINGSDKQREYLEKIDQSCQSVGVAFTWEFDADNTIHARHIITDHGWKIALDRGLDIFQQYDMNDTFTFANRLQQFRNCKAFEVTFIKHSAN